MEFAETSHHITPSIHTYYIQAHGAIPLLSGHNNNIVVITIPDNIELFTYASLGKVAHSSCNTLNYVCKKQYDEHRGVQPINTPVYKYIKKFPQIILGPDVLKPEQGKTQIISYTGIMHCIPKSKRDPTKKGQKTKEVIHNIDTNPLTDCSDGLIHPTTFRRVYKANTNYSEYYKTVLTTNQASKKREPPLNLINKCGMLFLSEAIEIVNQHCRETYKEDYSKSIIQIHVMACLVLQQYYHPTLPRSVMGPLIPFSSTYFEGYEISDPYIKDTPTSGTYSFMFRHKIITISFPKSESDKSQFSDISNIKLYTNSIITAFEDYTGKLSGVSLKKKLNLLPENIIVDIPEDLHLSTEPILQKKEKIANFILNRVNEYEDWGNEVSELWEPAQNQLYSDEQSRKKAEKLTAKHEKEAEQSRKKAEKMSAKRESELEDTRQSKKSRKAQEDSKLSLKGGKKRLIKRRETRQKTRRRQRRKRTKRLNKMQRKR